VLKARMGPAGAKVPARQLPNWLVRLAALRDPALKQLIPELGTRRNGTNAKARGLLGWKPRTSEDAIVACAESLIRLGLLKDTTRQSA
jgi:nucleoside-diphosphate-sugar epimerase